MDTFDNVREVLASTIRRSSVLKAVNRSLLQRENKTRAQYLNQIYNQSRSSYTRARLRSVTGFEEPEQIKTERKIRKRDFSLPNISAITETCLRTLRENKILSMRGNAKHCRSTPVIEEGTTSSKQNSKHSRMSLIAETVFEHNEDGENTCTNGESDATPKTIEINSSKQNVVASPSSNEILQEGNAHKTWTQFTDTTMQNFLKDLGRKVPNAYVLELLSHRLHKDTSENTVESNSVSKQCGSDTITDLAGRCQTENNLSPLNKRVIVIAQSPKVSPHPRRRFCTKMQPTVKDTVILKRNSATNINFYCKGNVFGVFKFTLPLITIGECLKVVIESVHFYDEYKPGNEFVYVTGNINRDGIVDKVQCLKTKAKPVLSSKQVHFNEEISVMGLDTCHLDTCSLTFQVFSYTTGISRTQRCVAESCVDLKDLRIAETDMHSAFLLSV